MKVLADGQLVIECDYGCDYLSLLEEGGVTGEITVLLDENEARSHIREQIRDSAGDLATLFASLSDVVCAFLPTLIACAREVGGEQGSKADILSSFLTDLPVNQKPWEDVAQKFAEMGRRVSEIIQGGSNL